MDNIKKIDTLVFKATSQSTEQISLGQLKEILQIVNSRADMPKHTIASVSKRMVLKNKKVLINVFTLLEYLAYECELSLYSQISTKEFLFKISGMLTNKEIDQQVKNKILQTIYCWQQLFRPHEDLLPLFFQFFAGVLRNGFDIPHDYKSPFRPAQLKKYKKAPTVQTTTKTVEKQKSIIPPSIQEKKTFQEIRQKLIVTNQLIDASNPAQNVKDNEVLLQMMQAIKQCQKKVNKTIEQNPTQNIMELALAANDDIQITYRRFKDLQKNRRPAQPFILSQLASDVQREAKVKKTQSQTRQNSKIQKQSSIKNQKKPQNKKIQDFLDFDAPSVPVQKKVSKKQQNILDLDIQPQTSSVKEQPSKSTGGGDIFDLLGDSSNQPQQHPLYQSQPPTNNVNFDLLQQNPPSPTKSNPTTNINNIDLNNFDSLLLTTQFQPIPPPSGNGIVLNNPTYNYNNQLNLGNPISLNSADFTTQADFKNYNTKSAIDRLDDLTSQYLKK